MTSTITTNTTTTTTTNDIPWTHRPSILSHPDYSQATLSRRDYLEAYRSDSMDPSPTVPRRASPTADGTTEETSTTSSSTCSLRTLQWNLNGWTGDTGLECPLQQAQPIMDAILEADADCIILNEYCWNFQAFGPVQAHWEAILRQHGYTSQLCGTVGCPTFCATRLPLPLRQDPYEIVLSPERSAIVLTIQTKHRSSNDDNDQDDDDDDDDDDQDITIVGTHLDHRCGLQRHEEMQRLLGALANPSHHQGSRRNSRRATGNPQDNDDRSSVRHFLPKRMILTGDLNQQRQVDYSDQEWKTVLAPNMKARAVCEDDGVDALLRAQNFYCSWDYPSKTIRRNWTTPFPPSTHWSGTVVDYAYGRNVDPEMIFISPVGWSDHRMTVVDWTWNNDERSNDGKQVER